MKIVFIGGGNMASAMIQGLLTAQTTALPTINPVASWRIAVVEPFAATREALRDQLKGAVQVYPDAASAAAQGALDAQVMVLAVKPQVMSEAARQLAPFIQSPLVISVAAGIRMSDLSRWLGGHARIVRAMPNTPALIGMGITGVCSFPGVSGADQELAESLLKSVGEVVRIDDESQIDAVTALSGSGPAYVYLVIEAMQAAGVALGLSADQADQLARQTVRGAAELAQRSDEAPSILRERVTSKGGTTAAALEVMQQRGLKGIFKEALQAAEARGVTMGEEFGRD
jgi:pyrroline-5-carboxylate reductase